MSVFLKKLILNKHILQTNYTGLGAIYGIGRRGNELM